MKSILLLLCFLIGVSAQTCGTAGNDHVCVNNWYGTSLSNQPARDKLRLLPGWSGCSPSACTFTAASVCLLPGVVCAGDGNIRTFKVSADWNGVTLTTIQAFGSSVTPTLGALPGLLVLDFSGMNLQIVSVSSAPALASTVTTLLLSGNRFGGFIPSNWLIAPRQTLDVTGNDFNGLNTAPGPVTVTMFKLGGNRFSPTSTGLTQIATSSVTYLDLSSQQTDNINEIPNFPPMTSLVHLDLSGNSFGASSSFPTWIPQCTNLEYLNLSPAGSYFIRVNTPMPATYSTMTSLKTFIYSFGGNQQIFAAGPSSQLLGMTNLEHLELGSVFINNFVGPTTFNSLNKLKFLSLDNVNINADLNLSPLSSTLEYLRISTNNNFPMNLANLIAPFANSMLLETVIFDQMDFQGASIPSTFLNIPALRNLRMTTCQLGGELLVALKGTGITKLRLNNNGLTNPNAPNGFPNFQKTGGVLWDELFLAQNNICPSNPGDYSDWAVLSDASLGACPCVDSVDCLNGCSCSVASGGAKVFPCLYQGSSTDRPPFFFGAKCDMACNVHCLTCVGPTNGECIACNNPALAENFEVSGNPLHNYHIPAGATPTLDANTCLECAPDATIDVTPYPEPPLSLKRIYVDQCVPAPTTTPEPTTPAPTAPPCMAPNKIDGQEQHCAVVAPIRGELYVHNSQRSGTRTNIHITIIGRWGKRTAKFIDNRLTSPSEIVRRTFFGLDVGPLISFELGTFSSTNDLRYFKVVLQRMPHLIMPGLPGKPDYTVQEGPIRTFLHDTTIKPGYISLLSNQMLGPNGFSRAHSFSDPIVTPPTCSGVSCKCSVIDPNPAVAAGCYWRHNQ